MVASMFVFPIVAVPPATGARLALFTVELRTGRLRWLDESHALEVLGVNGGDLRDAESTRALVRSAMRSLDDQMSASPVLPSAPEGLQPQRRVSPRDGYFAVDMPAGWKSAAGQRSVTANGLGLRMLQVDLERHGHAFKALRQASSPSSTPDQLLEWSTADLLEQQLPELRIVETSTSARLVDHPACRVRFVYRPWQNGPLMEAVTTRTATRGGVLSAKLRGPHLALFDTALPVYDAAVASITLEPRHY